MKAQEELEKILTHDAVMECKKEELIRLKSLAEKITASMEGEAVSGSKNLDPMGAVLVKIDLKKEEIERLEAEHEQRKNYYACLIDNLRKPVFIKILYRRYFFDIPLKEIANELGFCYRNICYLHGNALQAVENARKEAEK